jgi:hypothetical protein
MDMIVSAGDPRISCVNNFSLYMFTLINGYVMLHNIFFDGNTFTDSHSIDKKYFVGETGAGIGMANHYAFYMKIFTWPSVLLFTSASKSYGK